MSFLDKLRANFSRFMAGRYGVDQLSYAAVIVTLVLSVLGALTRFALLTLLGDALIVVVFLRMFSKNRVKRAQENQLYLQKTARMRKESHEWVNRLKNAKQYHYYVCPTCKTRLRVPRGVGNVTITCKGCGNRFDKKA